MDDSLFDFEMYGCISFLCELMYGYFAACNLWSEIGISCSMYLIYLCVQWSINTKLFLLVFGKPPFHVTSSVLDDDI